MSYVTLNNKMVTFNNKYVTFKKIASDILGDGNTVGWYDYNVGITKTDASVSAWADRLGSGRDLVQATGSKQPAWSSNGVLFDGVDDFMKTAAFTYNQPAYIYIVINQVSWTTGDTFFDGNIVVAILRQISSSPLIQSYASLGSGGVNGPAIGNYGIIKAFFNGANSKLQTNADTAWTGDLGAGNLGGFTLGANGFTTGNWANIQVKEIILRKTADSADYEDTIYNYLKTKYSL